MQIYLPIAEMAISAESIFFVSALVGFLSGIFGIGGGFLTTPFLIFTGIPPAIAVGTQATQLVASSTAGVLAHWGKGHVDLKIGVVMLIGGVFGSLLGIFIFKILQSMGQIDFAISILYVFLLGMIGMLMLYESFGTLLFKRKSMRYEFNTMQVSPWIDRLPYKVRFPRSNLYMSVLVPGSIGFAGGILASVLGIGGGFLLVPAMLYIIGMPAILVAGTSLFQMIFTTGFAVIMHAMANNNVDVILAFVLIIGGVVGAQIGVSVAGYIRGTLARIALAFIILGVCFALMGQLFVEPDELFSTVMGGD